MVSISEIVRLAQLYPIGSLDKPIYAFAGGTAVQCWLHNSTNDRKHYDIDIFAFNPHFLKDTLGVDLNQPPFFIGGLAQDGIVAYSHSAPIKLQITRGSYFDAEITPTLEDVRSITIGQASLLALSPEFVVVSQLSYPNVHHPHYFQDVLALNQSNHLRNSDNLSILLAQTSLGKLIDANAILRVKTLDDLQALIDSIHYQLIKRFLYWDRVNVDALDPFQIFVLLDLDDELFNLPTDLYHFIDLVMKEIGLNGRELQMAKLGVHFLTIGIPSQSLCVLQCIEFQALIRQWVALLPRHPDFWLLRTKNVLMTIQQLTRLEDFIGIRFSSIWKPDRLVKIIQRILFDEPSRLTVLTLVKSVYYDLQAGKIPTSNYIDWLHELLEIK